MPTLEEQLLEVIDYRNLRNFDHKSFQSYNAEEIENCAKQAAIVSREFAIRFAKSIHPDYSFDKESNFWLSGGGFFESKPSTITTEELLNLFESQNDV